MFQIFLSLLHIYVIFLYIYFHPPLSPSLSPSVCFLMFIETLFSQDPELTVLPTEKCELPVVNRSRISRETRRVTAREGVIIIVSVERARARTHTRPRCEGVLCDRPTSLTRNALAIAKRSRSDIRTSRMRPIYNFSARGVVTMEISNLLRTCQTHGVESPALKLRRFTFKSADH